MYYKIFIIIITKLFLLQQTNAVFEKFGHFLFKDFESVDCVKDDKWSNLVAIYNQPIQINDYSVSPICAGTLFSPFYVITAAHCISDWRKNNWTTLYVRIGLKQLKPKKEMIISSHIYFVHPHYKRTAELTISVEQQLGYIYLHDIGLVRLDQPYTNAGELPVMHNTPKKKPIFASTCLSEELSRTYDNINVNKVKNKVMHDIMCENYINEMIKTNNKIYNTPLKQMLSEAKNLLFCTKLVTPSSIEYFNMTVGGPLFCDNIQYGVASIIANNTIWTSIAPYMNWITDILAKDCEYLSYAEKTYPRGMSADNNDSKTFNEKEWASNKFVNYVNWEKSIYKDVIKANLTKEEYKNNRKKLNNEYVNKNFSKRIEDIIFKNRIFYNEPIENIVLPTKHVSHKIKQMPYTANYLNTKISTDKNIKTTTNNFLAKFLAFKENYKKRTTKIIPYDEPTKNTDSFFSDIIEGQISPDKLLKSYNKIHKSDNNDFLEEHVRYEENLVKYINNIYFIKTQTENIILNFTKPDIWEAVAPIKEKETIIYKSFLDSLISHRKSTLVPTEYKKKVTYTVNIYEPNNNTSSDNYFHNSNKTIDSVQSEEKDHVSDGRRKENILEIQDFDSNKTENISNTIYRSNDPTAPKIKLILKPFIHTGESNFTDELDAKNQLFQFWRNATDDVIPNYSEPIVNEYPFKPVLGLPLFQGESEEELRKINSANSNILSSNFFRKYFIFFHIFILVINILL